jgi:DinB family protein
MAEAGDDVAALERAFAATEHDARALVNGLSDAHGTWRAQPGSWSVAECLDHLATANRIYLQAMRPAAARALTEGRRRRGPVRPGIIGGWFVRSLEPPVRKLRRMKAPAKIRPRPSPPLADAMEKFVASQHDVVTFLRQYAEIDLAGVLFPNPFITGLRFSLATGLHVLAAHERRHLWQAWRVRRDAEQNETR